MSAGRELILHFDARKYASPCVYSKLPLVCVDGGRSLAEPLVHNQQLADQQAQPGVFGLQLAHPAFKVGWRNNRTRVDTCVPR